MLCRFCCFVIPLQGMDSHFLKRFAFWSFKPAPMKTPNSGNDLFQVSIVEDLDYPPVRPGKCLVVKPHVRLCTWC